MLTHVVSVQPTDFKIHIPHEMFEPGGFKQYHGEFCVDSIASKVDTFSPVGSIVYDLTLTNTGDAFLLSGSASCSAKTQCSRCLEECEVELNGEVDGYYLLEPPQDSRDEQINEFEILPADHVIDAGELICASLIVDAPQMPLCSAECKGLCSGCGANLNHENCTCAQADNLSDSPFAALRDFKVEE